MDVLVCDGVLVAKKKQGKYESWECEDGSGNDVPLRSESYGGDWSLSIDDAELIISAALMLWAVAYCARLLINFLKDRR